MTQLMIVESPAKAKKISGYLGAGWQVLSSMGHVCDLPAKALGVAVDDAFTLTYEVLPNKGKLVKRLTQAIRDASTIYVATDPDREGEAIAWHILKLAKVPKDKPIYRVTFNAITADAVKRAVVSSRPLDTELIEAQQTRRIVDRLVGYLASPLACQTLDGRYSAGRVQSACLRLIVERERAIGAFVPQDYQQLSVRLGTETDGFIAKLHRIKGADTRFNDPAKLSRLVDLLGGSTFTVESVKQTENVKQPAPPFTTSTLQQSASQTLGLSPDRVMDLAQLLYEQGLITYHRTDGVSVAPEAQMTARAYIDLTYGADYLPAQPPTYHAKSASAQEAHEGIRPTDIAHLPQAVDGDGMALYKLIWEWFIASQMAGSRESVTTVIIHASRNDKRYPLEFRAVGRRPVFDGFQKVYQAVDDEEERLTLPDLQPKQSLTALELWVTDHQTQPPNRFSEAGLIAELERVGIGRPSTYASTVKHIKDKGYVRRDKKHLIPTETGEKLLDYLLAHFGTVFDVGYIASLETDLDRIASGEQTRLAVLRAFWEDFQPHLTTAAQGASDRVKSRPQPQPTGEPCPKCGAELLERHGSRGSFIGCSAFPQCTYTRGLEPVLLHATEQDT